MRGKIINFFGKIVERAKLNSDKLHSTRQERQRVDEKATQEESRVFVSLAQDALEGEWKKKILFKNSFGSICSLQCSL